MRYFGPMVTNLFVLDNSSLGLQGSAAKGGQGLCTGQRTWQGLSLQALVAQTYPPPPLSFPTPCPSPGGGGGDRHLVNPNISLG